MFDKQLEAELFILLGPNYIFNSLLENGESWVDYFCQHIGPVYRAFVRFERPAQMVDFLVEHGRNGILILEANMAKLQQVQAALDDLQRRKHQIDLDIESMDAAFRTVCIKYGIHDARCKDHIIIGTPKSSCPCKSK